MPTVNSPEIVEVMLANRGNYPGDPPAALIYQYQTPLGATAFTVFWHENDDDMNSLNPYDVREVKLLWQRGHGLTNAGREWLQARTKPAAGGPNA